MISRAIADITSMIGGTAAVAFFFLLPIGALYWIWVAIQLGSFMMFVIGIAGPFVLITSPLGLHMLVFGTPMWVLRVFG